MNKTDTDVWLVKIFLMSAWRKTIRNVIEKYKLAQAQLIPWLPWLFPRLKVVASIPINDIMYLYEYKLLHIQHFLFSFL